MQKLAPRLAYKNILNCELIHNLATTAWEIRLSVIRREQLHGHC